MATMIERVQTDSATVATKTITFGTTPNDGDLLVFAMSLGNAGNDYDPVPGAGISTAIAPSRGDFRTMAVFYKIAGASETNSYDFSTTVAISSVVQAWRFSDVPGVTIGETSINHDVTTTSSSSTSLTATAGSLLLAFGYTSDNVETKTWNAGWLDTFDGITLRRSSAWKESAGGSETATYTMASGTNNRFTVAMTEFLIGSTAETSLDAPLVYGSAFSGSYSGFEGVPENTATVSDGTGSDLSVAVTINDNGDGTGTFTGTMPSLPAAGQNITGVSLGNVTFGLADPGA